MKFIQVGRVATHRKTGAPMIITDIINDKFVITQDLEGERYKLTVSQLVLTEKVFDIKPSSLVAEVKSLFVYEVPVKANSDFERFKEGLMNKIKEDLVRARIN